jgi:hypothetical protein
MNPDSKPSWVAFLVEAVDRGPLPQTYLPIWPCRLGPREPLHPGFDWPFGDCVINTNPVAFYPDYLETGITPHMLPPSEVNRIDALLPQDRAFRIKAECAGRQPRINAARQADGYSTTTCSRWTDFSLKSTQIFRQAGELFARMFSLYAQIHYDLQVVQDVGTRVDLEQDERSIKRCTFRSFSSVSS